MSLVEKQKPSDIGVALKTSGSKKGMGLWFLFLVLNLVNAFLSYSSSDIQIKGLLFIFGIVLPIYIALRSIPVLNPAENYPAADLGPLFLLKVFFILFLSAAIFLRFYRLQTFHLWPSGDESLQGLFAIDLIRHWNWRFFYTTGQHAPLLIWLLKWLFQCFESPFLNLWLLPACLSIIFVFLSYWTARLFFPKNVSAVYFSLTALSFWPMCSGRFCVQGVLVPAFETTVFLLLGYFLKSSSSKSKSFFGAALGFCAGLGTWAYTSWFVVVFFLILVLIALETKKCSHRFKFLWIFLFFLVLSAFPWMIAAVHEKFGGYVLGVSFLGGYFNWKEQILNSISYLTTLFWGTLKGSAAYGPVWGGMLNPFLTTCFFIGVIRLLKDNREGLSRTILAALLLFVLPGVLSADHVEMFRVIQLMPLLILVASIGLVWLLEFIPGRKGLAVFWVILLFSFSLDLIHLIKVSDIPVSPIHSVTNIKDENYWAYQKLELTAQLEGPGLIFADFILLDHDHTLNVTSYHFNALLNPKFRIDNARWAGVVTNVHYVPFLSQRFPESHWYRITPYAVEDGGSAVGIISLTPQNMKIFSKWVIAHDYFHQLSITAENTMNNQSEYLSTIQKLSEGIPLIAGDHFLEACFGEWVAQYHFGSDFGPNIQAIHRAIEKGYPTANLYYKLGNFYLINHQAKEAHHAYLMAAKSNPNYTNVKDVLSYLGSKH